MSMQLKGNRPKPEKKKPPKPKEDKKAGNKQS
ncbi:MAG: hypothetical protein JWP00_229 [Chloroflexi bacterium]|nr:hypothetical protein [Chloroflexota bacterium]